MVRRAPFPRISSSSSKYRSWSGGGEAWKNILAGVSVGFANACGQPGGTTITVPGPPHHPVAGGRLPALPVVGGADAGLEGEHVQLALEHVEQLLLRVCTWAPTSKPGGTSTSKVEAVRECEPVTLNVTRWAGVSTTRPCPGGTSSPSLVIAGSPGHGQGLGPRINAPFLKGT